MIRPQAENGYYEVMLPLEIKQLINACPGRFKVDVFDHPSFIVEAREHVMVTRTCLYLGLEPNRRGLPTRSRPIDIWSVRQIEPLPSEERAA